MEPDPAESTYAASETVAEVGLDKKVNEVKVFAGLLENAYDVPPAALQCMKIKSPAVKVIAGLVIDVCVVVPVSAT